MAQVTTSSNYINPRQAGGIESYVFADGEAFGTRALLVNTGGGLRYRVLPDRGLDIDQAFFNQHSLAFHCFTMAWQEWKQEVYLKA